MRNDAIVQGGGGTSFSAPAMAGIQALINQKFGRQGDANYVYYALARRQFRQPVPPPAMQSGGTGNAGSRAACFHDITRGDMDIPCGRNPDGNFYHCFGALGHFHSLGTGERIYGELSSLDSSDSEPAYPATVGL